MAEALVLGGIGNFTAWGTPAVPFAFDRRDAPKEQPRSGNAWISAQDVAQLLLAGECRDARVSVPARFSPQAVESAISSVQRWTREGRIFAINDLYPRYQFDSKGRPYPLIECALAVFGAANLLRVGNWFATPNAILGGSRPQELLATKPADVMHALRREQ